MNWSVLKKIILNYQYLIKLLLSLVFLCALLQLLFAKKQYLENIEWEFMMKNWYWMPVLLVMALVNWSLEARKWQLITSHNSFLASFRIVLTGLLFKQFIPFGIGEISGRMLADVRTAKKEAAGAFMLIGFVQFSITIIAGSFGLIWLLEHTEFQVDNQFLIVLTISFLIVLSVITFRAKLKKVYNVWFEKLTSVSRKLVFELFFLSLGRYLIFFSQSIIVYSLFINQQSLWLLSAGISFVFLAKTIVPSLGFLGDIGVRGFSAVLFFSYFDIAPLPVVLSSLAIWVINIFLPSFVALFMVRKLSFYSKV